MQKGIYKYRTDTRRYKRELHKEEAKLLDYKMHLVIRFVLFLKYLITFRMQDAKDALVMPIVHVAVARNINIVVEDDR